MLTGGEIKKMVALLVGFCVGIIETQPKRSFFIASSELPPF